MKNMLNKQDTKKILHMALCVHHISIFEQNYQVWDLFMFHNLKFKRPIYIGEK